MRMQVFMVINKIKGDDRSIISQNEYYSLYIYLGAQISDDGHYSTVINLHAEDKSLMMATTVQSLTYMWKTNL